MTQRLVSVDDTFALPPAVKVLDGHLPARLQDTALNATYLDKTSGLSKSEAAAAYVPKWQANTAYAVGAKVLSPAGDVVSAKTGFTSGASYSAANWDLSANVTGKLDKTEAATTYAPKDSPAFTGIVTVGGVPIGNSDNAVNLVGNGNFETTIPLNDTTTTTNWRNVDGVNKVQATVTDGPGGATTKVMRIISSSMPGRTIQGLIAGGYAGKTMSVTAKARALQVGAATIAAARVFVVDSDTSANLTSDTSVPLTLAWTPIEVKIPIPATTNNVTLSIGRGTPTGSGQVEFDDVQFKLSGTSLSEAATAAVVSAASAGTVLTPAAADAAYGRLDQRPDPMPAAFLAYSKGGVVGTSGRVPVALRFDDWQDNMLSMGMIAELTSRGLFGSVALCSHLGSNPWNSVITWDNIRDWNRNAGMEIWSHGTDHNSPYSASPATNYANLVREIVTSKAEIDAQGLRCMGWAMPGVGAPGYGSFLMTPADWASSAGRLLTATYGVVETDMTNKFRHLPGGLRYGLGHYTISDGATLQQSKDVLDGAIALGFGVEFMTHAGNLDAAGNATYADFKAFLDYIVAKRDAGLIEFVSPSTLPFCDPNSTRRLELFGNPSFEAAVPMSTTVHGNWRNVDGTARQVVSVADGHGGGTTNVLRLSGSSQASQVAEKTIGRGIAGQTLLLDAWVRGVGGSSSVRFTALDTDNSANMNFDKLNIPVTATWQRIRIPFAVPPMTDNIVLALGRGTTAATTNVEWDDVHVYVA